MKKKCILRYMEMGDVGQVIAIDAVSFDPAWTADSYEFEIKRSSCSYMVVMEERESIISPTLWQTVNARLKGEDEAKRGFIVGYGGLWKIQEEAHISTIATHPDRRGLSYGEALLMGMVRRAHDLGAEYIVLEVRVSNIIAQALYGKYGFVISMTKPHYYRSNNEDAYEMRLDLTDEGMASKIEALYSALQARLTFEDAYSTTPHDRLGH